MYVTMYVDSYVHRYMLFKTFAYTYLRLLVGCLRLLGPFLRLLVCFKPFGAPI